MMREVAAVMSWHCYCDTSVYGGRALYSVAALGSSPAIRFTLRLRLCFFSAYSSPTFLHDAPLSDLTSALRGSLVVKRYVIPEFALVVDCHAEGELIVNKG
jgi:hypothetical protein